MKRQGQFRYSQACHYKWLPQPDEGIYDHQDQYNVRHQYIRDKHFDEHFKRYADFVKRLEKRVGEHRDGVVTRLRRIKEQIELFERELDDRTMVYLREFQIGLFQSENDRRILQNYQQRKYEEFTCKEMHRLLTMTDAAHIQTLQRLTKRKIDQHIQDIQLSLQGFIKRVYEEHCPSILHHQPSLIKLSESSIKGNNNQSMISEGLLEFKAAFQQCFQAEQKPNMAKKKQQYDEEYDSLEIVQDDQDMSYYQINKEEVQKEDKHQPTIFKVQQKKGNDNLQIVEDNPITSYNLKNKQMLAKEDINPSASKPNIKAQQKKELSEMTKAFTDRQSQWSKQDQQPQQNQEQIMKDIHSTQAFMSTHSYLNDSRDFIQKISDLQYMAIDSQQFNIRVKVVRVLYFCVVLGKYFKMKFIAGDETGLAVFFTNYSQVIKPNVQLQFTNCKIKRFKESLQVVNDKHFRQINHAKGMIKVNQHGDIFSKGIEIDLYYRVSDKNCQLIREVAERLINKNNFPVSRMVVQVVFILNQWTDRIFCQVGDSSGLMLAYIKKEKMMIKEGNVLKLNKIVARRGSQPNKLMNEEIIYLDGCDANAKVSAFRYQFLEISDSIMSA